MAKSEQTQRVEWYIFMILKILVNEVFELLTKILENTIRKKIGDENGGVDLKSMSPCHATLRSLVSAC